MCKRLSSGANEWSFLLLAVSCSLPRRQSAAAKLLLPLRMSDSDSYSSDEQPPEIHEAIRNLDVDALRIALPVAFSIEETDDFGLGWTPLYHACANRGYDDDHSTYYLPDYWNERVSDRVAIVRALLDAGASVHARCDEPDDTPLHAAVMNDNFPSNDIVEMLIAAGADVNAADNNDYSVLYSAA